MLSKLIKYDIKWINKLMVIYFAITVLLSVLTRISSYYTDTLFGNIIYGVLRGCTIGAFVSCVINMVIRIWVRFRQSIYKDESYLTHTLPVSKNTLYDSKIISAVLSITLTFIVIIACFCIAFLDNSMLESIKQYLGNNDVVISVILIILVALLEFIYMNLTGLTSIIIGHRSNNNKVLKSVLYGIVIYFSIQLVLLGIVRLVGFVDTNIGLIFTEGYYFTTEPILKLLYIVTGLYLIANIILYFIGKLIFNKGVNVE